MRNDIRLCKVFDTCKLEGKWKQNHFSPNHEYIAQEDSAHITLNLIHANLTETFYFKKGSTISIKDSLMGYFEKDLLES